MPCQNGPNVYNTFVLMSEVNSTRPHSSMIDMTASDRYQRWRLLKDKLVARGVVTGGLSVIVAILLIFFYLLYVVFPLLLSSHADVLASYDQPEAARGRTVLLTMEEQNEVGARFTENGQVIFFKVASGERIAAESLPINAPVDRKSVV